MEEDFEANTIERQAESAKAQSILQEIADRIGFIRHPDETAASNSHQQISDETSSD
jgi:hypothetical protein